MNELKINKQIYLIYFFFNYVTFTSAIFGAFIGIFTYLLRHLIKRNVLVVSVFHKSLTFVEMLVRMPLSPQ